MAWAPEMTTTRADRRASLTADEAVKMWAIAGGEEQKFRDIFELLVTIQLARMPLQTATPRSPLNPYGSEGNPVDVSDRLRGNEKP